MTTAAPSTRKTIWKVLFPMAAILVLVIAGLSLVKSQVSPQSAAQPVVGSVVPEFTLTKFPEGSVSASSLQKKVIVINFWATWCEACMVEMPSLIKLRQTYKDKGLELI